jgi:uncharacterized tellurite resistance protein B-like protein
MMLDVLLKFFTDPDPVAKTTDSLQVMVAVLLVEAANRNDRFPEPERAAIRRILAERYRLEGADLDRLLAAADRLNHDSVQLFRFTDGLSKNLDAEQRVKVIEMLWEVAYADGVLTADEDSLIRQVAGLLLVPDRDRGAARKRVMTRLGLEL